MKNMAGEGMKLPLVRNEKMWLGRNEKKRLERNEIDMKSDQQKNENLTKGSYDTSLARE
jgi:hypothetical protein